MQQFLHTPLFPDSDWAQQNYGLIPVLSEVEDNHVKDDVGPFRYALAVLRSSDGGDYRNISSLKGKKSCHGSINALAGWNAPLSKLRELKLIGGPTCGLSIEMSQFFGNTSCVPGAKDLAGKTKMPWLPKESLCALCAGDGPRKICKVFARLLKCLSVQILANSSRKGILTTNRL